MSRPEPVPLPTLPEAPTSISDGAGVPLFGTYRGSLPRVDLESLSDPYALTALRARTQRKRWLYTLMGTPEVLCVMAMVDVGYSATGFISVVDLKDRRVLFDDGWLFPPGPMLKVGDAPAEGLSVRMWQPGLNASVERAVGEGRYRVRASISRLRAPLLGRLTLDAQLIAQDAAPPVTVIAPLGGDRVNVTQKEGALGAFGRLTAGGRSYRLDGGVGGMDYTQGLLPRHTTWRWAYACGRLSDGTPISVNLVQGFNEERSETNECVVWVGRRLIPLPRTHLVSSPRDVLDPWTVRSEDGNVDLTFKPLHAHRESRNLGVVTSRFVQPLGLFRGTIRAAGQEWTLEDVPGVTEHQDVIW